MKDRSIFMTSVLLFAYFAGLNVIFGLGTQNGDLVGGGGGGGGTSLPMTYDLATKTNCVAVTDTDTDFALAKPNTYYDVCAKGNLVYITCSDDANPAVGIADGTYGTFVLEGTCRKMTLPVLRCAVIGPSNQGSICFNPATVTE